MLTYIRQVNQIKRSVTIQANDKKESRVNQAQCPAVCFPPRDARHMHNQWLKLAQILALALVFTLDFFLDISASLSSTACWEYANNGRVVGVGVYGSYTSCFCLCVQKVKYVCTVYIFHAYEKRAFRSV